MSVIYRTEGRGQWFGSVDRTVELAFLFSDPTAFPLRAGESENRFTAQTKGQFVAGETGFVVAPRLRIMSFGFFVSYHLPHNQFPLY